MLCLPEQKFINLLRGNIRHAILNRQPHLEHREMGFR